MNDGFFISKDKSLLQIQRIHQFLSEKAYWCLGVPLKTLERAIENSLCFGVYEKQSNNQVGFARVVTDYATFAWLCDVYIEENFRGLGLSKKLMESIMGSPELQGLRRICLATKDAHELYKKSGFEVTKFPDRWMEIKNDHIYKG